MDNHHLLSSTESAGSDERALTLFSSDNLLAHSPDQHNVRLLWSLFGRSNQTPAPSAAPSAETTSAPGGINSLAKEFEYEWIIWLCLGLLGAYVSYKGYRWMLRRRRIYRSEQAGGMLGDLQMLPSSDHEFSDHIDDHEFDDDGAEEEPESELI